MVVEIIAETALKTGQKCNVAPEFEFPEKNARYVDLLFHLLFHLDLHIDFTYGGSFLFGDFCSLSHEDRVGVQATI